jgi:pyridoxamine 5'-phosphate oxidase
MSSPRWKAILERSFQNTDKISAGSQCFDIFSDSEFSKRAGYYFATSDGGQPRVRTILHRGFFTPNGPGQPIFATTTDIRSHKSSEILDNPNAEAVWYLRGSEEQFRFSVKAYIVPHPQHPLYASYKEQFRHLVPPNFDWETERRDRFNDKSPAMRASWVRPRPGSAMNDRTEADSWPTELPKLGEGKSREEDALIQLAYSNFALLLLDPRRLDWAELGAQPNRRTVFTKQPNENEWKEQMVVP